MEFTLKNASGMPVSDEQLIDDLLRVATLLSSESFSQKQYDELGSFNTSTISRRFGSWNLAMKKANLKPYFEPNITDERLFENILALWRYYGRQPVRIELSQPPSEISQSPYNRRFGSWTKSLNAFINYINQADAAVVLQSPTNQSNYPSHKTPRDPSLRLKWKVFQRDNFTCRACGRSPATDFGLKLRVDHIIAWSQGGETVLDNLQSLCEECNLGKSNT